MEITGLILIGVGVWMAWPPLLTILVGFVLLTVGYAFSEGKNAVDYSDESAGSESW